MGFFAWLKEVIKKDLQRSIDRSERKRAKNNPSSKPFKERYVEPKREENYTKHDLIALQAWVSNVKDTNPDGVNRQEILAKCQTGDDLTFRVLEHEHNYYTIEVHTVHGCIGTMWVSEMQKIARYILNGGVIHNAKISLLKYPKTKRGKIECAFTFERNKMR